MLLKQQEENTEEKKKKYTQIRLELIIIISFSLRSFSFLDMHGCLFVVFFTSHLFMQ